MDREIEVVADHDPQQHDAGDVVSLAMTDLPPPGWYDDPTHPAQERWWDGTVWGEQTRRKATEEVAHRHGELRTVSDFVSQVVRLLRARWDDYALVAVIAGAVTGIAAVVLVRPVLDGIDIVNEELVGWQTSYAYRLVLGALVAFAAYLVAAVAFYRLAWGAATNVEEGWATAVQYAIASSPRFVGWIIVGILPFVGFVAAVAVLTAAGVGILGLALFIGVLWWTLVIVFIPVAFVSQPRGTNPIAAALAIVKGRWWRILGRTVLISFMAGLVLQVIAVILTQLLGINVLGMEIVETADGQFELVKDLDDSLPLFIGITAMSILSMGSTAAQAAAATAIADDLMDLEAGLAGSSS